MAASVFAPDLHVIPLYDAKKSIVPVVRTAQAGQTVFRLDGPPLSVLGFVPRTNSVQVFVDGAYKVLTLDFIEVDEFTIQFNAPLTAGQRVVFLLFVEVRNLLPNDQLNQAVAEAEASVEEVKALIALLGDVDQLPVYVAEAQFAQQQAANSAAQAIATVAEIEPLAGQITEAYDDPYNNSGFKGLFNTQSSALIVGDSLSSSVGASSYVKGKGYTTALSMMAAGDQNYPAGSSLGYPVLANMQDVFAAGHGSSPVAPVVQGNTTELNLGPLQYVEFTGYSVDYMAVWYRSLTPGTTLQLAKNGVNVELIPLTANGVPNCTFGTKHSGQFLSKETDVWRFTVSAGGAATIIAPVPWRQAALAVAAYLMPLGGTGFRDWITPEKMDMIAKMLSFGRGSNEKVFLLDLGANPMYNSSKYRTPVQMAADAQELVLGVAGRVQGGYQTLRVLIALPPKTLGTMYPLNPAGTYEQYVDEMYTMCKANGYGMVPNHRTRLGDADYTLFTGDGLHYNDLGHAVGGSNNSDALGIPYRPYEKTTYALNTPFAELGRVAQIRTTFAPLIVGSSVPGNHTYNFQRGVMIETPETYEIFVEVSINTLDAAMDGAVGIGGFPLTFAPTAESPNTGYVTYRSLLNLGAGYDSLGFRQINLGLTPFLQLLQSGNASGANVITKANMTNGTAICGHATIHKNL